MWRVIVLVVLLALVVWGAAAKLDNQGAISQAREEIQAAGGAETDPGAALLTAGLVLVGLGALLLGGAALIVARRGRGKPPEPKAPANPQSPLEKQMGALLQLEMLDRLGRNGANRRREARESLAGEDETGIPPWGW